MDFRYGGNHMGARRSGTGQQEILDPSPAARRTLAWTLTPGGQIRLVGAPARGGDPLPARVEERIAVAFARGRGHGVLRLGAAELATDLDPTLGFWSRNIISG